MKNVFISSSGDSTGDSVGDLLKARRPWLRVLETVGADGRRRDEKRRDASPCQSHLWIALHCRRGMSPDESIDRQIA